MIECDVAVIICSRGREDLLTRLLLDLHRGFTPALEVGNVTCCIFVYAQGYSPDYIARLESQFADALVAQTLIISVACQQHTRIGDVVHTAIQLVHERACYKMAMLMDDDSLYNPHPIVDANVRNAACEFINRGHRAYSMKLGQSYELDFRPFVDIAGPIMPFKEKMLWVSYGVLDEILVVPRFNELSIGEDAIIAAVAWLADPSACFAVDGIATFLHLGFEQPAEFDAVEIKGGYAALMNYEGFQPAAVHGKYDEALRTGVTPHHILPDVFVPEDHPHYIFNGIREEMIVNLMRSQGRLR
jgi:hypothetical protein